MHPPKAHDPAAHSDPREKKHGHEQIYRTRPIRCVKSPCDLPARIQIRILLGAAHGSTGEVDRADSARFTRQLSISSSDPFAPSQAGLASDSGEPKAPGPVGQFEWGTKISLFLVWK